MILRKNKNPWEKLTADQFIQSVENVIPNPPFQIVIESLGKLKIRDEDSFHEISPKDLKNHTWNLNENIREITVTLNKKDSGILGSAIVALLESQNNPVEKIETGSKNIVIDGEIYELEKSMN